MSILSDNDFNFTSFQPSDNVNSSFFTDVQETNPVVDDVNVEDLGVSGLAMSSEPVPEDFLNIDAGFQLFDTEDNTSISGMPTNDGFIDFIQEETNNPKDGTEKNIIPTGEHLYYDNFKELTGVEEESDNDEIIFENNLIKAKMMSQVERMKDPLQELDITFVLLTTLSQENIRRESVVSITEEGPEGPNTVNDPKMGVSPVDRSRGCSTCGMDIQNCPGHIGRIDLEVPVVNPFQWKNIINILNSVCNSCGKVYLSPYQLKKEGILGLSDRKKWAAIAKSSKGKVCVRGRETSATFSAPKLQSPIFQQSPFMLPNQGLVTDSRPSLSGLSTQPSLSGLSTMGLPPIGLPQSRVPSIPSSPGLPALPSNLPSMGLPPIGLPRTSPSLGLPPIGLPSINSTPQINYQVTSNLPLPSLPANLPGTTCTQKFVGSNCKPGKECELQKISDIADELNLKTEQCKPYFFYLGTESENAGIIKYRVEKDKKSKSFIKDIYDVISILESIPEDDLKTLGFARGSRPVDFIFQSLPVIPPCARPPRFIGSVSQPDPLTDQYVKIIKINNQLRATNKGTEEFEKLACNLRFEVKKLFVGDANTRQGQQKFDGLKDILQGKEGLFRQNFQGKRVNYSARTVASPDPSLEFGWASIPQIFAPMLTVPEPVTEDNLETFQEMLYDNKISYVEKLSGNFKGRQIYAGVDNKDKSNINMKPGDVVHRHLMDGDWVIINRQPTLHKFGMMAFQVKLVDRLTVGMNLASTSPLNLDFDGDEVNVHVPQTIEARAALATTLSQRNLIINNQNNAPVVGLILNNIVAAYLLTEDDNVVDLDTWNEAIMSLTENIQIATLDERLEKYGILKYSGKALFSSLLPEDLYYKKGDVLIVEGVLLKGRVMKDHIGRSGNAIHQQIVLEYGNSRASKFITDSQFLLNIWLDRRGFTVGIKDCIIADEEDKRVIAKALHQAILEAMSEGPMPSDPMEKERWEKAIMTKLDIADTMGKKMIADKLAVDNNLRLMAVAKSKGTSFNIAQSVACVGQRNIGGARPGEDENLPYVDPCDLDPRARGFITSSYYSGLNPMEMFFEGMKTREGILDTAAGTGPVGDLRRRMQSLLENLEVNDDGSVRDDQGNIYQLTYSDTNLDPAWQEMTYVGGVGVPFFMDLKYTVDRINASYGYY